MIASKNSNFIVLQQCQNKVNFQRKDSGTVLTFSPNHLKDRKCSLMNTKHFQSFKIISKILIRCQNHFFGNLLDLDVAGEQ